MIENDGIAETWIEGYLPEFRVKNYYPRLDCVRDEDKFTLYSGTALGGNGLLSYPVGTLTVDEVIMAGAAPKFHPTYGYFSSDGENKNYYLYTGYDYWTISPYYVSGMDHEIYTVTSNGGIFYEEAMDSWTTSRPVINLRKDAVFSGTGTASDPFIPVGIEEPMPICD